MRNLILFSGASLICFFSLSQEIQSIDTLYFTKEKSYSRIVARYSKNELVFGTSKTGVILYNEKSKETKTLVKPVSFGEFRDVVIDGKTIYTCVSGDSGVIYKVKGKKVSEIYRDINFIDDLVLKDGRDLIMLSDPIFDHQFFIEVIQLNKSRLRVYGPFKGAEYEAFYAASGTTAQFMNGNYYHVSGGPNNATFYRRSPFQYFPNITAQLPLPKAEGGGPFSILMLDNLRGVIVGGNYTKPNESDSTACYTTDGGKTWKLAEKQTGGYRSCVTGNEKILFACGTNGMDYSTDGGKSWNFFTAGNFCALLLEEDTLYATTNKGYCLKMRLK